MVLLLTPSLIMNNPPPPLHNGAIYCSIRIYLIDGFIPVIPLRCSTTVPPHRHEARWHSAASLGRHPPALKQINIINMLLAILHLFVDGPMDLLSHHHDFPIDDTTQLMLIPKWHVFWFVLGQQHVPGDVHTDGDDHRLGRTAFEN